jgi:hypothetical protein
MAMTEEERRERQRAHERNYNQSPKGKATKKRREQSPESKAARKRYQGSQPHPCENLR